MYLTFSEHQIILPRNKLRAVGKIFFIKSLKQYAERCQKFNKYWFDLLYSNMFVLIKALYGERLDLMLDEDEYIHQIRIYASEKFNIPFEKLLLYFNDNVLQYGMLSDYDIRSESILYAFESKRKGAKIKGRRVSL